MWPCPSASGSRSCAKNAPGPRPSSARRSAPTPSASARYENGRLTRSLAAAVRLAEALDVSVDYPVIERASRRSLTDADSTLAARLAELGTLDDTDRDAVLHIIDGLIAKNRVRHALSDAR